MASDLTDTLEGEVAADGEDGKIKVGIAMELQMQMVMGRMSRTHRCWQGWR